MTEFTYGANTFGNLLVDKIIEKSGKDAAPASSVSTKDNGDIHLEFSSIADRAKFVEKLKHAVALEAKRQGMPPGMWSGEIDDMMQNDGKGGAGLNINNSKLVRFFFDNARAGENGGNMQNRILNDFSAGGFSADADAPSTSEGTASIGRHHRRPPYGHLKAAIPHRQPSSSDEKNGVHSAAVFHRGGYSHRLAP